MRKAFAFLLGLLVPVVAGATQYAECEYGAACRIPFMLFDKADPTEPETNASVTVETGDVRWTCIVSGTSTTDTTTIVTGDITEVGGDAFEIQLGATETDCERIMLFFDDATGDLWFPKYITIDTVNHASAGIPNLWADVQEWLGTAAATPTAAGVPDVTMVAATAAGIQDFFTVDSTDTYADAVAGSVVKEISDNAAGSGLSAEQTRAALGGFGANIDVVDSQTDFDLDNGSSTNDVYNNNFTLVVTDASNSDEPACHRRITDWVGADQTVTIDSACGFTVAGNDDVVIMPNGVGDEVVTATAAADEFLAADCSNASTTDDTLGAICSDWEDGGRLDVIQDNILTDTETTIPGAITTAQSDLDTLTGSDGATLATAQANYAPLKPTTAGRTLDINVTGEVAPDFDAIAGTLDAAEIGTDAITATKVAAAAIGDSEWDVTAADANLIQVQGHALAGTGTQIADGIETFFDVAAPTKTMEDVGGGSGQTPLRTNTTAASGHSSTTVVLDAGASPNDDAYTDYAAIKILSGDCVGQSRTLTGYVGSTKTGTVAAWAEQGTCSVAAGDLSSVSYELVSVPLAGTGATASEVWAAGTRSLTELDEASTTIDIGSTPTGAAASVTGAVGSVTGNVGGSVASVTADVEVGSYDSGLDFNATQKASINTQVDQGFADYDGPTSSEMDARTLPAASYFDPAGDTVANVTTTANLTNEPNVWDDASRTLTALDEDDTTVDLDGTTVGTATDVTNSVTANTTLIEGSDATDQIAAAVSALLIEGSYDLKDVLATILARQVGTVTKAGDTYTVKEPSGVTTRVVFEQSGTTRSNVTITPP